MINHKIAAIQKEESTSFQIFIKDMRNKTTYTINISNEDTIEVLTEKIENAYKTKFPKHKHDIVTIRLLFAGSELNTKESKHKKAKEFNLNQTSLQVLISTSTTDC